MESMVSGGPRAKPPPKTLFENVEFPRFLRIPGSQIWPPGGPPAGPARWPRWHPGPDGPDGHPRCRVASFWLTAGRARRPPRGAAAGPSRRWALLGRPNGLDFKSVNGALKMLLLINWIAKWKVWFLGVPGPYPLRKTLFENFEFPRFLEIPGSQIWPPEGPPSVQSGFRSAGGRDLWLAWGVRRVDSTLGPSGPPKWAGL